MKLSEHKRYHKNPRKISDKQLKEMEAWMEELGDLSGIVVDLNSNEIIGGNQRSKIITEGESVLQEVDPAYVDVIVKRFIIFSARKPFDAEGSMGGIAAP